MQPITFSVNDIILAIRTANARGALGPDFISPALLSKLPLHFSRPLAIIFERSFESGELPTIWKHANVVPIYKNKGSHSSVNNYRPISLTCVPCKIMENIIRKQWLTYLIHNKIITSSQFGFIPKGSVEYQLLDCLDNWSESLDKRIPVDCIYFDLSKAFDTVSHVKLLYVLSKLNTSPQLLSWLKGFISNRFQRVVVGAGSSSWLSVTSGVPQGSVLGPLLFLLYINDLPSRIKYCKTRLFADDIKLYPTANRILGKDKEFDYKKIQEDVEAVSSFAKERQLGINFSKCVVLRLGSNNVSFVYTIDGHDICSVKKIIDLGVIIDDELNFSAQCTAVAAKARRICGLIIHSFATRDASVLMKAFNTYVMPIVLYCSCVWSPRKVEDRKNIESVLKSFTKHFTRPPYAPINYQSRLMKYNIMSLSQRRIVRDIVMTYKILNNYTCLNPSDYYVLSRRARVIHPFVLSPKPWQHVFRHHTLSFRIIEYWNKLPREIFFVKRNENNGSNDTLANPDLFKARVKYYCKTNMPYFL